MDDSRQKLRQKVIDAIRDQATPIDFDTLIQEGVLTRQARGWYILHDMRRLPAYASKQITTVEGLSKGRTRVKFDVKGQAQAAKLYEKVTGTPFQPRP